MSDDEYSISDFWNYKSNFENNIDDLKKYAREYYTSDFIVNFTKWKKNLAELNDMLLKHIKEINFPIHYWQEMSFDYFCENINLLIEKHIEKHKNIQPIDITDITKILVNNYIKEQNDIAIEKYYTVSSLLESIKKIVII